MVMTSSEVMGGGPAQETPSPTRLLLPQTR